ncbi:hypothetical protein F3K20_12750 [Streptomyces scabiei]|uniref:hypothetical protein n=1 Tax=Streptomyces scabiei TaxID=1930 RepID=UPI001B317ADC|nr:hypothetical protein [Streptomyces sp. LBUM 1482]QTU45618.1 hypothetical protein F3K20_12750 [Streptomyces sp. LBUM 1482]
MTAARILGVTIAAGPLLGALLLLAVGWLLGHSTARIRIVNVGATAAEDETALTAADAAHLAHERARFDDLMAQLDLPEDLRSPE